LNEEFRLGGFLRAFGPFSHPIMAGTILASMVPLYWYSGLRNSIRAWGTATSALAFFSLSSAAIIALVIAIVLGAIETVRKRIRGASWWTISLVAAGLAAAIQAGSTNGIINILIRFTFDPQTASYRLTIWKFGVKAVELHPLWGIGYEEYERPLSVLPSGSVDAHFLAVALSNGVVAMATLLIAVLIAMLKLGVAVGRGRGRDRDLLFAVNVAVFILFFASMTVTFYNEGRVWFMIVIGIATSMGQLLAVRRRSGDPPLSSNRARARLIHPVPGSEQPLEHAPAQRHHPDF
jgi:O-antigen ligase